VVPAVALPKRRQEKRAVHQAAAEQGRSQVLGPVQRGEQAPLKVRWGSADNAPPDLELGKEKQAFQERYLAQPNARCRRQFAKEASVVPGRPSQVGLITGSLSSH